MTVCIAARCNEGSIFCAADRMVTVGDMEMESPVSKIVPLTSCIAIMPSDDDAAFHAEIISSVNAVVSERVTQTPNLWWTVKEVVDLYVEKREAHRTLRAERDILKPLGLNLGSFNAQQQLLDPALARQIASDLVNYKIPFLSVIITGVDPTGAHIYIVSTGENENIDTGCYDIIGHASIGAGRRHANAELLRAGQCWKTSLPETLWNIYLAKKRAEVAPGVGKETDVVMLGPQLGGGIDFRVPPRGRTELLPIMDQLEKVYNKTLKREEGARKHASQEMTANVQKLVDQQTVAEQQVKTEAPGAEPTKSQGSVTEGGEKPATS